MVIKMEYIGKHWHIYWQTDEDRCYCWNRILVVKVSLRYITSHALPSPNRNAPFDRIIYRVRHFCDDSFHYRLHPTNFENQTWNYSSSFDRMAHVLWGVSQNKLRGPTQIWTFFFSFWPILLKFGDYA